MDERAIRGWSVGESLFLACNYHGKELEKCLSILKDFGADPSLRRLMGAWRVEESLKGQEARSATVLEHAISEWKPDYLKVLLRVFPEQAER